MYYCMNCAQIGETVFAVRRVQKRITVGIGTTRDTWHETGRFGFHDVGLGADSAEVVVALNSFTSTTQMVFSWYGPEPC